MTSPTTTTRYGVRHPEHQDVIEFDADAVTARRMVALHPECALVARTVIDTGWQRVEP